MMKKQIEGIDVPDVPEFLEMVTDAGGHLWACRMSADIHEHHQSEIGCSSRPTDGVLTWS